MKELARVPLGPRILRELDILPAVRAYAETLKGKRRVIRELGIARHSSRIDLAAICDDRLEGFEIKSNADTHGRFEQQAGEWLGIFDLLTLVVTKKHLDKILGGKAAWSRIVPEWWGLILAEAVDDQVRLLRVREPAPSPRGLDVYRLSQCFWKCEIGRVGKRHLGWTAEEARSITESYCYNVFARVEPKVLAAELREVYMKRKHLKGEHRG